MTNVTIEQIPCRWRGAEISTGNYSCSSDKLIVGPFGVRLSDCARCYCRNHDMLPPEQKKASLITPTRSLPCNHKGREIGRVSCPSCRGHVEVKAFSCTKHKQCTDMRVVDGHACCYICNDYDANLLSLVAPVGCREKPHSWQGRNPIKPWDYQVTVAIPHLESITSLKLAIELIRRQSRSVYILIIDTGSSKEIRDELEKLRTHDLEIHYILGHGYWHGSAPVATAMDFAFSMCRTALLIAMHSDVFLRRRDAVEWLVNQCSINNPVIGWEQSPRGNTNEWQGCVSHTFTVFHMPTMRKIGATWGFERYYEGREIPSAPTVGMPDTEQPINECLRKAGIKPILLGTEPNYERHITEWFDHPRSMLTLKMYGGEEGLLSKAKDYVALAEKEAQDRIQEWSTQGTG